VNSLGQPPDWARGRRGTRPAISSRQATGAGDPQRSGLGRDHDSAKSGGINLANAKAISQRHDPPLNRSSIILRALTWKRLQQPSSRVSALLTTVFRAF
jgi:hypothetical protein